MSRGPSAQAEVRRLANLVLAQYIPDSPTHDHSHLERVAALTMRICTAEGGNQLVALSAAWLHDLHRESSSGDSQFFASPEASDERAERFLAEAGIPKSFHGEILDAIHYTDRYSFSDRPPHEARIEAQAVRDADNLDAIGAIGIARAFSFGGAHGIPLWEHGAEEEPETYVQSERPPSTIHHFHEKLLRLPAELETETAIKLAGRRSTYMEQFVDEFMYEWRDDFNWDGSSYRIFGSPASGSEA
jgi:uncharacterized protein